MPWRRTVSMELIVEMSTPYTEQTIGIDGGRSRFIVSGWGWRSRIYIWASFVVHSCPGMEGSEVRYVKVHPRQIRRSSFGQAASIYWMGWY